MSIEKRNMSKNNNYIGEFKVKKKIKQKLITSLLELNIIAKGIKKDIVQIMQVNNLVTKETRKQITKGSTR